MESQLKYDLERAKNTISTDVPNKGVAAIIAQMRSILMVVFIELPLTAQINVSAALSVVLKSNEMFLCPPQIPYRSNIKAALRLFIVVSRFFKFSWFDDIVLRIPFA